VTWIERWRDRLVLSDAIVLYMPFKKLFAYAYVVDVFESQSSLR
jgi:hypothetical protein